MTVELYDTTLRDGSQAEEISFTVEDKLRIAEKLDELGIGYIEAGWPGSNPKDDEFFQRALGGNGPALKLTHAKLTAFGSTRRRGVLAEKDRNLQALLKAGTPVVTIFGKSWDLHVTEALHATLEENLELIHDSVRFLKERTGEVLYDAEHFFDGFKTNPEYALKTIGAAADGGASRIVLCDTNGGSLPTEVKSIVAEVTRKYQVPFGIHCHNDAELAVANSLAAIEAGAGQVHGTINGIGERCGNANLVSVIANLKLKLGINCLSDAQLQRLREVSRFVDELANRVPSGRQPYVGDSAFAHKGGVHVSAILKNRATYEHINPEAVGNRQRVLISELAGQSSILYKARESGIDLDPTAPAAKKIVEEIKDLENRGYEFEGAEGSLELLMRKSLKLYRPFFKLLDFRVVDEKGRGAPHSEARLRIQVGRKKERTRAIGHGPVNAMDNALRKALERFYPQIREVTLVDYKVRVLPAGKGTASQVRVLIESRDKNAAWGTVGVSENIIEASWQALVDSLEYKLIKGNSTSAT